MTPEEQEKSLKAADLAISETRRAMESAGFTCLKLAKRLHIMAFSDIKNHVSIDEDGALQAKTFKEMGKNTKAVKKIKETTKITKSKNGAVIFKDSKLEFELYDALEAGKFAAALMGMQVPQKHEVSFDASLMSLVAAQLGGGDGTDPKPKD